MTGNRPVLDTFDRNFPHEVKHISLAEQADLVLIAPATANVLAKLAHGLADDMLTTTAVSYTHLDVYKRQVFIYFLLYFLLL